MGSQQAKRICNGTKDKLCPLNLHADVSALAQIHVVADEASLSRDAVDMEEVFEMVRHVHDPEHPLTLEQLKVVSVSALRCGATCLQGGVTNTWFDSVHMILYSALKCWLGRSFDFFLGV